MPSPRLALAAELPELTIERALWVVVLLFAGLLRLWDLGGQPLQSGEAAAAMQSWQMLRGEGGTAAEGGLLGYGTALVFFAFGASDASARLLPALAGTALAGLPFFLRDRIGRWGALAAALLLAASPAELYFARLVDSQALAACAALLAVVCLVKVGEGAGRGWVYRAAVALGLLLLAGRDAYTMLAVLAAAGAAVIARRESGEWTVARNGLAAYADASTWRSAAIVFGAVVLLGTTALFLNLHGIQEGIVTPFGRWLASLAGDGLSRTFPLEIMLAYEPVLLLFGFIGAAAAARRGTALDRFLVWWAAGSLAASMLSGERPPDGMALALVPVALLAGPAAVRLIHDLRQQALPWAVLATFLGTMLSLLALLWIAAHFFTVPGQVLPAEVTVAAFRVPVQGVGGTVVPALAMVVLTALLLLALWIDANQLPKLSALLLLVVLTPAALHFAVLLNYAAYSTPGELLVPARTSKDARVLASDVAAVVEALAAANRPNGVQLRVDDDAVRWYLRDVPSARLAGARPGPEAVIVSRADAEPPVGQYALQRYRLESSWNGRASTSALRWRWLSLRETPGPVQNLDLTLYVRAP